MARLSYLLTHVLMVAGLVLMTGCQEQPVVSELPSANFNGPMVPAPTPVAVEPVKPAVKSVQPQVVKPAAPVTAAIPREWIPSVRPNDWNWIVIHHSATPGGGAVAFDRMHRQKGWDELGYHFVIGNGTDTRDGQVEVGGRWTKQKHGAHAKTPDNRFNEHGIGICLVGNFDNERPTRAQMVALARLVAYLQKTYRVPSERVLGHGETKATDCPGRNLHIAEVKRMAAQMASLPEGEGSKVARGEMLADVAR